MTTAVPATDSIADRLAIVDLINRYFEVTDAKRWDLLEECFVEDAVVHWTSEKKTIGRSGIVGNTRSMLGTDEIVTYHHVANFTPVIDGDTAEATVRVRAMHNGVGSRDGRFWESLAIQNTHLARTAQGWRCSGYEWRVVVGLGSLDLFDGFWPETS